MDLSGSFIISPDGKKNYNDLTEEGKEQYKFYLAYLFDRFTKEEDDANTEQKDETRWRTLYRANTNRF